MNRRPPTPILRLEDHPDSLSEVGQKMRDTIQQATSVATTALYQRQRREDLLARRDAEARAEHAEQRSHDDEGRTDATGTRREAFSAGEELRRDVRKEEIQHGNSSPTEAPTATEHHDGHPPTGDSGVDGSNVIELKPQDPAGRPDREQQILEQLQEAFADAADASEAGALWSQSDDNPNTVSLIGGTNRNARGPRTADARGDSNEQAGEEASTDFDPLAVDHLEVDHLSRDPLDASPLEAEPLTGQPTSATTAAEDSRTL